MKNLRNIISYIVSFILCLTIFMLSLLIIFKITVGDIKYINKTLITSKYSVMLTSEIKNKLYNYGDISGIPHTFFDEIITESRVLKDTREYFNNSYTKNSVGNKNEQLNRELTEKLSSYIKPENAEVSDEEFNRNVKEFVKQCVDTYNNYIRIPLIPEVSGAVFEISKLYGITLFALSALIIICLLFFYFIAKRLFWKHLINACTGSAFMLFIIPAYLLITNTVSRLNLGGKPLYFFLKSVFKHIISLNIIFIFILVSLAILFHFINYKSSKIK